MNTYWKSLDGVRALAVVLVILSHIPTGLMVNGGVGVDMFFVLSGFLITGILSREVRRTGRLNFRNFYARRALRLVPCLLLACGLGAAAYMVFHRVIPLKQVSMVLTYTANWWIALYNVDIWCLGPTWSLAAEEQYYLMWPLVVLALGRWCKGNFPKFLALAALAVALAVYRGVMLPVYGAHRIYFGLDTHMDGLVLGSALAYLLPCLEALPQWKARIGRVLSFVLTPLALTTILVLFFRSAFNGELMVRFGYFTVALSSAVLILDIVFSPFCLVHPVMSARPVAYIGRISYGLYLLHLPIVFGFQELVPRAPKLLLIPVVLGATFLVAALSFRYLEQPFLQLKSRFESSPRPREAKTEPETRLPLPIPARASSPESAPG